MSEDEEAGTVFDRAEREAGRVAVPMRTICETIINHPASIGDEARACQADVVVSGKSRESRISRLLTRDSNPSILGMLPERAELMIRAS